MEVANTEAPDGLELIRQFVNTIDLEAGSDPFQPHRLEEWCRQSGFEDPLTREEVADLCRLREAIRAILEAHAGEGEEAVGFAVLQPLGDRAAFKMRFSENGALALEPVGSGAEAIAGTMLAAIYDAVRVGTWSRLKACRKHSCRWAFYDRSKNGSGAWCDMAICGNRVKAQRRRTREKQTQQTPL